MARKIVAIITLVVVSIIHLYSLFRVCLEGFELYLFPRVFVEKALDIIILAVALIVFVGALYLIYKAITKLNVSILIVAFLLFISTVTHIFAIALISERFMSHTDDTENFLVLDERAELYVKNVIGRDVLEFDDATVKEYEYKYRQGLFLYEYLEIETLVELTDAEFEDYLEIIRSNGELVLDSSYTADDGSVRYLMIFDEKITADSSTEECFITLNERTREV